MPIRDQVVLPKRVVPQPTPEIQGGGDCGACVLGGLLGISPAEIYPRFELDPAKHNLGYLAMYSALWAEKRRSFDRIVTDIPMWLPHHASMLTYGVPAVNQAMGWFHYVHMALDAGYYGIANVDHAKKGGAPDHWVLVCGAREIYPEASGVINQEILVSCSSRKTPDEEWVEARDFLRDRGGFNLYLARPKS